MSVLTNAKHEAVAQAFIADPERVGWRAYSKVYADSSQAAAESSWSALLRNPKFSARLAELAEAAAQVAVMTANEVLQELSKVGRANMLDYMSVGAGGDPVLDFSKLTRDQAAALAEVTVEDFMDGRGEGARAVREVKFKLASKLLALELLGKHHKLYTDRVEHEYGGAGLADRLAAALARVGKGAKPEKAEPDGKVRPRRSHPPRGGHARKAPRKGKSARAR
jgi:phage terminase small subunit